MTEELAARMGVSSREPDVLVDTANGPATAKPIVLDTVALQGATAARVNALVMKRLPEGIDGLIGLSFLSRFEMNVNRNEGRLELTARTP